MYNVPNVHIASYLDTSNAANKTSEKQVSQDAFMPLLVAVIPHRTAEGDAAKRIATKMEEQLKSQVLDEDAKPLKRMSVSPPCRKDSAASSSPSDKDIDFKVSQPYLGDCYRSRRCLKHHRKDEKRLSTLSR